MAFIPLTEDQWVFCQKLYKYTTNQYLNADINGALNILKKSSVADLSVLYGRGQVDSPLRIRLT